MPRHKIYTDEQLKEKKHNYYQEHKEKWREYHKKYREKFGEEIRQKQREYYQSHKEQMYVSQTKYRLAHKKKIMEQCIASRKRRIERMKNEGIINVYRVINHHEEPIYGERDERKDNALSSK